MIFLAILAEVAAVIAFDLTWQQAIALALAIVVCSSEL